MRINKLHSRTMLAAPALLFLSAIFVFPFFLMLWLSFRHYTLTDGSPGFGHWVGVSNYYEILHARETWHALAVSAIFTALTIIIQMSISLIAAYALTHGPSITPRLIPLIAVPSLLSPVATSLMWIFILHPQYGPVSSLLRGLDIQSYEGPLSNPSHALIALVAIDTWQWIPMLILILYAGLLGVSKSATESARIDGATNWQRFKLSFSFIRQLFISLLALRILESFREFDKIFASTGGGPGNQTETIAFLAWRTAFKYWQIGLASSLGVILYLALFIVGSLSLTALLERQE